MSIEQTVPTQKNVFAAKALTTSTHQIELSRAAVLATRKLFNHLSTDDLDAVGFDDKDIEAFGELFLEIKEQCEEIEMGMHD